VSLKIVSRHFTALLTNMATSQAFFDSREPGCYGAAFGDGELSDGQE
jgi:hypothetical protein